MLWCGSMPARGRFQNRIAGPRGDKRASRLRNATEQEVWAQEMSLYNRDSIFTQLVEQPSRKNRVLYHERTKSMRVCVWETERESNRRKYHSSDSIATWTGLHYFDLNTSIWITLYDSLKYPQKGLAGTQDWFKDLERIWRVLYWWKRNKNTIIWY